MTSSRILPLAALCFPLAVGKALPTFPEGGEETGQLLLAGFLSGVAVGIQGDHPAAEVALGF